MCRISSSSARTAGSFRRSPFQGPVPSTFAAVTGLSWRTPTRTSINSGTTPPRHFPMSSTRPAPPGAETSQATRRRSPHAADPESGHREVRQWLHARGDDWSALIDKYITVTNRVLKNAPSDMAIGMHLCRGNRGGQWHSEGGYDEVADRLFNALNIQSYFLEYDTP